MMTMGSPHTAMHPENIYAHIPAQLPEELIEEISTCGQVRIERILSRGHRSAKGFWYEQRWDEWVLLVKGTAGLDVAGRPDTIELNPGDHLMIPAGVKHRVAWTADKGTTIWLAIHIDRPGAASKRSEDKTLK